MSKFSADPTLPHSTRAELSPLAEAVPVARVGPGARDARATLFSWSTMTPSDSTLVVEYNECFHPESSSRILFHVFALKRSIGPEQLCPGRSMCSSVEYPGNRTVITHRRGNTVNFSTKEETGLRLAEALNTNKWSSRFRDLSHTDVEHTFMDMGVSVYAENGHAGGPRGNKVAIQQHPLTMLTSSADMARTNTHSKHADLPATAFDIRPCTHQRAPQ